MVRCIGWLESSFATGDLNIVSVARADGRPFGEAVAAAQGRHANLCVNVRSNALSSVSGAVQVSRSSPPDSALLCVSVHHCAADGTSAYTIVNNCVRTPSFSPSPHDAETLSAYAFGSEAINDSSLLASLKANRATWHSVLPTEEQSRLAVVLSTRTSCENVTV
ncbi:hypothetical protein BC830DRAFT_1168839 [Chytriomyces sp. MP71]|nr:hypothetical protein BC830DRAFT_1168839 [Chytriomyces sp. MP71]